MRKITWGAKISAAKKGHSMYKSPTWLSKMKEIGDRSRGKKLSTAHIEKIRQRLIGHPVSEETRRKLSAARIGRHFPKLSLAKKGKPNPLVSLAKRGKPCPNRQGSNAPNWRGGINPINHQIRHSLPYRTWRAHVFRRDDYTCQSCGSRGGKLEADHELPFSEFPALHFEILNGRTLCQKCHRSTPTWGRRSSSNDPVAQISTFLS